MAQSTGAHLNFPELDLFLDHLYSRWSPEARAALCNLKPGANDSTALAIFDHELTTLRKVGHMVRYALRNIAASVGSQRNRYCKINDLPVEILREILLSACENGLRWKDLASIIKTCKPWYNILAHDPAAYSTIDFGDYGFIPRLAKFFAKRSQSLPLDIIWTDIGAGTSVSKWKNKFCARHVSRVRALEFVHLHPPAGDWQLTTPAPQLERCKLVHCVDVENASEDGNDADFEPLEHIIPHLFGGDTPQLRTLDLHEVRLAWRPSNYSDLTYVKITLHSELLAQTHYDSDYITVIFRDSPRLERVELITSGSEDTWRLSDDEVPQLAPAQQKCVMRRLHTLHLHLSGPYIISILRAIEITPTIKTVDLHCGRNGFEDAMSLEILGPGALPDFLFTNLRSFSIGKVDFWSSIFGRPVMAGSGILNNHKYSLLVSLPTPFDIDLLVENITSSRHMLELRRLELPAESTSAMVAFLAISPGADEIIISQCDIDDSSTDLRELLSGPRNYPLFSGEPRWKFACDRDKVLMSPRCDVTPLMALAQYPPRKRRTLFVDGIIQLQDSDGLRATRQFVVDLARLNVAILGPVKFGVGLKDGYDGSLDGHWDEMYNYTSVRALWPDGEVPELVQEVMGEVNV